MLKNNMQKETALVSSRSLNRDLLSSCTGEVYYGSWDQIQGAEDRGSKRTVIVGTSPIVSGGVLYIQLRWASTSRSCTRGGNKLPSKRAAPAGT